MQTKVLTSGGLFVLIEGCKMPALDIKVMFPSNSYGVISVVLPYHPSLWPPSWKISERPEDAEELVDESGVTIINDVEMSGMQAQTRVQAFMKDPYSGKTVLIQEGRIITPISKAETPDAAYISFSAFCSGSYPQEIQIYMADKARSLGISSKDGWSGELGASSPSDIASRIESAGLGQGIITELKNAGLNSNFFLHLLWRMMRYDKRFIIVDNPKALGYFNGSRLHTVFEETLSKYENKDSIAKIIQYILSLLRYNTFNVPFPSFVHKTQDTSQEASDASSGETPILDSLDNDEEVDISDMMINDWICSPDLVLSPPPRCNVIFPNQYGQLNEQFAFNKVPTRMIARASGTGKLTDIGSTDAVVKPDDMKDKLLDDRNYNSPEETVRGIIFSTGALDKPEFMSEMDSDYVKGFYEYGWDKSRQGLGVDIGKGTFNPTVVAGLPILILSRSGNHIVGKLESASHVFSTSGTMSTVYQISNARPYDTPISSNAGDLWYEQNMFGPEHIGIYFYPKILGKYEEERVDIPWDEDDMSILAVLNTGDINDEDLRAAKENELAIKNAADIIFEEYNSTPDKEEYSRRFGRRSQITFEQFIEDFYGCSVSADGAMATGGYSLATNSLSIFDGDDPDSIELGERIPDDAVIRGCYVKERQKVYIQAMQFFIKAKGVPIDETYMAGALEASDQAIQALIDAVEPDSSVRSTALGVLGIT